MLTGGKKVDGAGAFFEPTLLADVTPDMDAYSEELFGPVGVVYKVASADEAVELDQLRRPSGSAAPCGAPTRSSPARPPTGSRSGWRSSTSTGRRCPGLPFGGVKRSGFGRELGPWGMDEFVNKKLVRVSKAKAPRK